MPCNKFDLAAAIKAAAQMPPITVILPCIATTRAGEGCVDGDYPRQPIYQCIWEDRRDGQPVALYTRDSRTRTQIDDFFKKGSRTDRSCTVVGRYIGHDEFGRKTYMIDSISPLPNASSGSVSECIIRERFRIIIARINPSNISPAHHFGHKWPRPA